MKLKRIISVLLCAVMLLTATVIGGLNVAAQNDDVQMPMSSPVIDGDIETNGLWSEKAYFNEANVSNFWSGNPMSSYAELYFAYDSTGLYFAADITDNDGQSGLICSTQTASDYGFDGDALLLMLDPMGLFEKSEYQRTPWYSFGIYADGSVRAYRINANEGDITDSITVKGGFTDEGWCFEAYISWNDIVSDTNAASSNSFSFSPLSLIAKGTVSRAACMYMDRYQKNATTVDTWGRYITVCDNTYDGWAGSSTSGYTAKSFGLVLVNGEKPEHLWGEWAVTMEPTCAEEGLRIRECTDCDEKQEEAIPTVDHVWGDWTVITAATNTMTGLQERKCESCGNTEQEIIPVKTGSDQLIIAYFNASVAITAYEFHNIDVLNYHPATINVAAPGNSGDIITHNQTAKLNTFRNIAREQNPDIKFVFTVANNNLQVFESWFSTKPMAEKLAGAVMDIIIANDYDGFDIDYEFPTGAVNTKENFVYFMQVMREKLDALSEETGKEYILSMAVPGTQWTFSLFDMNALSEHVSYFNMMNYDLYIQHGTTHHHTPSYDNDASTGFVGGSVYSDIQLYLERGIPADKIVAGCGLYALEYKNVPNINNGLYQTGVRQNTNRHYTELKFGYENKGGYVKYWDEKAGASYLYNANNGTFFTYDDERSVEEKCKIVAQTGVKGIMVFDYCTTDGIGLFDNMQAWLDKYTPSADVLDQFTDVNKNAWYADAIRYCVSKGFAVGMTDTTFVPNGTLTRAQFVQLLAGIDGVDLSQYAETDSTFTDVKVGAWFHNAITWAVRNDYVAGMSPDKFKPNDKVTREQLVRILYNYAADNGMDMTGRADLTAFEDYHKVSDWAYEEMSWAVENGIISGMNETTIGPKGTATRAQAMQIIKQFDTKSSN